MKKRFTSILLAVLAFLPAAALAFQGDESVGSRPAVNSFRIVQTPAPVQSGHGEIMLARRGGHGGGPGYRGGHRWYGGSHRGYRGNHRGRAYHGYGNYRYHDRNRYYHRYRGRYGYYGSFGFPYYPYGVYPYVPFRYPYCHGYLGYRVCY